MTARRGATVMLGYLTQHHVDLVKPPDANAIHSFPRSVMHERTESTSERVNLIYLHTCRLAAEGPELMSAVTAGRSCRCRAQSSTGHSG